MNSDTPKTHSHEDEQTARREFLKQVGKVGVTAPAIALLLAASSKPASARQVYGSPDILEPDGTVDAGSGS